MASAQPSFRSVDRREKLRNSRGKSSPHGPCDCLSQVNAALAEKNAEIGTRLALDFTSGRSTTFPTMEVVRLNAAKRGRLPTVVATFCPFCGRKIIGEGKQQR